MFYFDMGNRISVCDNVLHIRVSKGYEIEINDVKYKKGKYLINL